MQDVRLVAIDLDGTLLGPDERIGDRDREAVARVVAQGVDVVLVTARGFHRARPYALELGLRLPILCCMGALVADSATGRPLVHAPLPVEPALAVLEFGLAQQLLIVAHVDGFYLAHPATIAAYADVASLIRPPWQPAADLVPYVRQGATFLRALGRSSVDILRRRFEAELIGDLTFVELVWRGLPDLGMYAAGVSKGAALVAFCRERGIDQQGVMAIGDNASDRSMFDVAGLRVAMGNADPELKAAADHVTATNTEGGVARALEQFVQGTR